MTSIPLTAQSQNEGLSQGIITKELSSQAAKEDEEIGKPRTGAGVGQKGTLPWWCSIEHGSICEPS